MEPHKQIANQIAKGIRPKEFDTFLKTIGVKSPSRTLLRQQRALDRCMRAYTIYGQKMSHRQSKKWVVIFDRFIKTAISIMNITTDQIDCLKEK